MSEPNDVDSQSGDPQTGEPSDEWLAKVYQHDPPQPDPGLDKMVLEAALEQHPTLKKADAAAGAQGEDASFTNPSAPDRSFLGLNSSLGRRLGPGLAAAAVMVMSVGVYLRVDETQLTPDSPVFSANLPEC